MNVYDFDGTIYRGDSSIDFFFFCLRRHPRVLFCIPNQIEGFVLYGLKRINKTELKEHFFSFLKELTSYEEEVASFWEKNRFKIQKWYLKHQNVDDVVISASPDFLLDPICQTIGINSIIASRVDPITGCFLSPNCHGMEKVKRFRERFPEGRIKEFYSDSKCDKPMMMIADRAYRVKNDEIVIWKRLER